MHDYTIPLLCGAFALGGIVGMSTAPEDSCTESATLPDVATPVTCAPPSVVSVRDSEHGPVVLCLCPTLTDGDDATPSFEATEVP